MNVSNRETPTGLAPNKHQARTAVTRQRLLLSARRIFARDGFEAARLEDIAKEAGYTRGAFYANFESKDDLFFALLEEQTVKRVKSLRECLKGLKTEEERTVALRDFYAVAVRDRSWTILMLEFKLYTLRHPSSRKRLLQNYRRIRAAYKMGPLQELLPACLRQTKGREDVRLALEALLSGLVLQHHYDPESLRLGEAEEFLRRWFDTLLGSAAAYSEQRQPATFANRGLE